MRTSVRVYIEWCRRCRDWVVDARDDGGVRVRGYILTSGGRRGEGDEVLLSAGKPAAVAKLVGDEAQDQGVGDEAAALDSALDLNAERSPILDIMPQQVARRDGSQLGEAAEEPLGLCAFSYSRSPGENNASRFSEAHSTLSPSERGGG